MTDTDELLGDVHVRDPRLSRRERAVASLFATGRTTAVIAEALEISQPTVNQYLTRARTKYEAVGRPARTRHDLYQRIVEDYRSLKAAFSDAELIDAVRSGMIEAYGKLYERHVAAAHSLSRQLARSSVEADDLVSDAFAQVLDTLREGRGPDSAFRTYLLIALRHIAYDKTRLDKRLKLADDLAEVAPKQTVTPFNDTAIAGLERSLAAKAFAQLPERWQTVLWHTEIESQSPADLAPLLGLTANGVSALAYRAREGLRQAYLQAHIADAPTERCRAATTRLGAWTRGGLTRRETVQVEDHLDHCSRCRTLAAELADINGALR